MKTGTVFGKAQSHAKPDHGSELPVTARRANSRISPIVSR